MGYKWTHSGLGRGGGEHHLSIIKQYIHLSIHKSNEAGWASDRMGPSISIVSALSTVTLVLGKVRIYDSTIFKVNQFENMATGLINLLCEMF